MTRWYRLLLKLYPARFREEFAAPLERQFADEYRDASTAGGRARLWLRTLADLAVTVPAELLREIRQDLVYAVRVYRRRSLATLLALAALALAIGATTGVFSVVNALLIRSLPFRQPDRLVEVLGSPVSPLGGRGAFLKWAAPGPYFDGLAGYFPTEMNLGLHDQSARVKVAEVSANFFRLLGCEPVFGRAFTADEDLAGRDGVAVIGYAFWQQFFGGDPRVLGSTIQLNGTPATVIGVAPAALDFPDKAAVWTPTLIDYQRYPISGVFYGQSIARLKSGLPLAQANALYQADVARRRTYRLMPGMEPPQVALAPLQAQLAGPVRQASFVLLGLVAFVLLIACANVAHLLLARAAERRQELTIRNALGASRARLVQQLITESTLLTLLATAAGLAVARWATQVAAAAQPSKLSTQQYSVLDGRVLAFAAALAALTGIVFGVLPAWLMGRMQSPQDTLRARGQSSGAGRMRVALLTLQGALTLVLLAGAFTMARSFQRLLGTDLGYRTVGVVTLNVSLSGTRWDIEHRRNQYYDGALARLRAIPGVDSAAAVAYLPLIEHMLMGGGLQFDAGHAVSPSTWNYVGPDYFATMRTRLVEGRDFTPADHGPERVAIVNQEFARQLGLGPHLAGKIVHPAFGKPVPITIVGVVESSLIRGPGGVPPAEMFQPIAQSPPGFVTFVAHVRGPAEPYLALCRDRVQQVDAQVPVYDVKTLDVRLHDTLARPRFYTTAVLFFAAFALLLAVVGIYGMASYAIAQRTHEIGVRLAIGASPAGLRGMLLRQSLAPLTAGILAGIAGAVLLGRYLQHLIAQADSTGAAACAIAAAILACTAALAVWTATARILRVDPTAALRAE